MGLVPCESNPVDGTLNYSYDEFHAVAVLTIQIPEINSSSDHERHESLVHVCFNCATKHFKSCYAWQSGIVWTK